MTQLGRGRRTRCVIAILVAAAALEGCGSSGVSRRTETAGTDARWLLLRNCVMNTASVGIDNEVVSNRARVILVYRINDLVAGINYEGTFANAEAAAKRHQVPAGAAPSHQKTGSWLAISNVAFLFSYTSTPAQIDRVTACLTGTYPGRPKWPTNVPLSELGSPDSPYT